MKTRSICSHAHSLDPFEFNTMVIGTYLHLLEDGGTIIGDDDLAVWADEHLVHAFGSEGGLHEGGDGARSHDVDLQTGTRKDVSRNNLAPF